MSLDAGRVGVRADQVDIHGRVTSPSFLNELLEDLPEWTDMPVWVNGTEELLPSNNSVPVTSPILTDIAYPDIRRDNQYFTYRESPTPVDGLAKIKSIKGNTLVWNQLASIVGEQTGANGLFDTNVYIYSGHKYLMSVDGTVSSGNMFFNIFYNDGTNKSYQSVATSSGRHTFIFNCVYTAHGGSANTQGNFWFYAYNVSSWKNLMLIDLTQMGLDITDPSEFTSLFPLSYYSYNQGSLLSFNGNGIKTVGKNRIKLSADALVSSQMIGINYLDNGAVFTANGMYARAGYVFNTIVGQQYTISFKASADGDYNQVYLDNTTDWDYSYGRLIVQRSKSAYQYTFTATSELFFVGFYVTAGGTSGSMTIKDIQLELGSSATSYVPYTSSTLSLPISTYFPTGMKSAGTVYDELTPMKAITRIGAVDLGTLTFNQSSNFYYLQNSQDLGMKADADVPFIAVDSNITSVHHYGNSGQIRVYVNDISIVPSGMFYYELETPVELPTLSLGE